MRTCADCGADLSDRHLNAVRCPSCSDKHKLRIRRERRKRRRGPRTCKVCGKDISKRDGRAVYCDTCAANQKHAVLKRAGIRLRRKRGERPRETRCRDCGRDISRRPAAAKRCKACALIHRHRKPRCIDCGANIRHLGVYTVRCLSCVQDRLRERYPHAPSLNPDSVPTKRGGGLHPVELDTIRRPVNLDGQSRTFRPLTVPDYLKSRS